MSALARLMLRLHAVALPSTVTDEHVLNENIRHAIESFETAVEEASAYTPRAQAEFVHYLQPHLLEHRILTAYQVSVLSNLNLTPPWIDRAFETGYPALRAALARLKRRGVRAFDISSVLADAGNREEFYFDVCHINHRGNEIVSKEIFDQLLAGDLRCYIGPACPDVESEPSDTSSVSSTKPQE